MIKSTNYDFIKGIIHRGETLVCFGAGTDGVFVAGKLHEHGIEEFLFCDTYQTGTILGHRIISMDELVMLKSAYVLISSRKHEKDIIISLLEHGIKNDHIYSAYSFFPRNVYFEGDFPTWKAAEKYLQTAAPEMRHGYAEELIFQKVHSAIMKVRTGEALFERDSFLFEKPEFFILC